MSLCEYCGGYDCIFCSPSELNKKAQQAISERNEAWWVREIVRSYRFIEARKEDLRRKEAREPI